MRDYLTGHILIAMPSMGDSRFENTVIFMCAHNDEHAMGITLNRPADNVTLKALLDELDIETDPNDFRDRGVLAGGPVEPQRGFVLHTGDYRAKRGTLAVTEDVHMTATHDVLRAIATEQGPPERAVLALGYAGWGAGQLESEIQANAWLHCPANPDLIFDDDHETKWARALESLGVTSAMLSAEWATPRDQDAHRH